MAFCEVYSSKPALFFTDDAYHIDKIGTFIARDFNISLGTIVTTTNGTITIPQNLQLSSPIKIGDIINVSLVNYGHQSVETSYNYSELYARGIYIPSELDQRNQLQQAFVVSNIDGDRLVLTEYNEYNHSMVTMGWVGSVQNEGLEDVLAMVTRRDMRAFASRLYPYEVEAGRVQYLPFRINGSVGSTSYVSFNDDFTNTNVKPFDVIARALLSIKRDGHKPITVTMGAVVKRDDVGYYVFSYIRDIAAPVKFSLRVKPSSNVKITTDKNVSAATVWIQPEDNGEDYIRAGVIIATNGESGQVFKTIGQTTAGDFKGYGITNIPSILIGYDQVIPKNPFEKIKKRKTTGPAPDKTTYENVEEYKADKKRWDARKQEVDEQSKALDDANETFNKQVKEKLGDPLSPLTIKELLADAFNDGWPRRYQGEPLGSGEFTVGDWYETILENIKKQVTTSMKGQFTPIIMTIDETDILGTHVEFSGDELVKLYFANTFGASINGDTAAVTQVNYTKRGRSYTLQTIPN